MKIIEKEKAMDLGVYLLGACIFALGVITVYLVVKQDSSKMREQDEKIVALQNRMDAIERGDIPNKVIKELNGRINYVENRAPIITKEIIDRVNERLTALETNKPKHNYVPVKLVGPVEFRVRKEIPAKPVTFGHVKKQIEGLSK